MRRTFDHFDLRGVPWGKDALAKKHQADVILIDEKYEIEL